MLTLPLTTPEDWLRQCGQRVRWHWPGKMAGMVLVMAVFFAAYFQVLLHPLFPVTIMPLTPLDRMIPFQPWAALPYFSLWFYLSLAPALLRCGRELISYGIAWVVLAVIGLGIFLAWPTAVAVQAGGGKGWAVFSFLQNIDATGNACPSLHVAFAVLGGIWLGHLLRNVGARPWVRVGSWTWCAVICYSTLAIRQHVVLDVVAGAALGAAVGIVHLRTLRRG